MCNLKHFIVIIFTISLIIYPLVSCANEVNKPQEIDRLPSGPFILNDMKWIHTTSGGGNNWRAIYDPETDEMVAYINDYYTATETISTRQISENRCELYSSSEGIWTTFGDKYSEGISKPSVQFKEDSAYTKPISLIGWISIEENRVYIQFTDDKDGKYIRLLYDFNLNVGDVFEYDHIIEPYNKVTLTSIDSVLLLNGEHKRRYNFGKEAIHNGQKYYDFSVIEGIGCDYELFYPLNKGSWEESHIPTYLKAVYYKDRLIWPVGGDK